MAKAREIPGLPKRKPFGWTCPRCGTAEQRTFAEEEARRVEGKGMRISCSTPGCGPLLIRHEGGRTTAEEIGKLGLMGRLFPQKKRGQSGR